ncbi:MAG: hypothetical protein Q4D90_06875 [bacterium]|nr:hypothetical protein [bacterium]
MKRIISFVAMLTLVLAFSFNAFAAASSMGNITERVDEYGQTVRTYETNGRSLRSNGLTQTKELLVALGMDKEEVDNLSSDVLNEFANSSYISVSTAYTKTDANNQTIYVDEATALAESKRIESERMNNFKQGISPLVTDEFEDTYMKIVHTATPVGGGTYRFITNATWLTMPFFRGSDSVGSCAMNFTVTNATRNGNYSYDMNTIELGQISTTKQSRTITDVKNAVNGNWYGSAGIVYLPNDVYEDTSSVMYTNYKAHYEYLGKINYPQLESNFNSVGSYDHATFAVGASPSLTIDTSGVSASIGLNVVGVTDTRSAEVSVHYVP